MVRVATLTDLLVLLATWGPCTPVGDCFGDIDLGGIVAVPDLLRPLVAWGACQLSRVNHSTGRGHPGTSQRVS